jgi:hypothetical protein
MPPRTRSTPSTEEAPNLPRNADDQTVEEVVQTTPSDLDLNLAAAQATIEKLQRLKDLQDQAERLRFEILGRNPNDPPPTLYRDTFQSFGKDQEIKLKDLPTFTLDYTLQKRQEWLLDLQQMFEGAPKKYYDDRTKILGAINHMNSTCRQRWYRHTEEKGPILPRNPKEDWPYFRDWTLILIKNAASLESEVMGQLEKTYQGRDEDPREFHARLDTLEQHFPRSAEKERALTFFAKLNYNLQNTIRLHRMELPETRDAMIDVAYHYWGLTKSEAERKRKRDEKSADPSRKKTSKDPSQNPQQDGSPRPQRGGHRGRGYRGSGRQRGHFSGYNNGFARETPAKDSRITSEEGLDHITCYKCGEKGHYANSCSKKSDGKPAIVQNAQQGNDSETE